MIEKELKVGLGKWKRHQKEQRRVEAPKSEVVVSTNGEKLP